MIGTEKWGSHPLTLTKAPESGALGVDVRAPGTGAAVGGRGSRALVSLWVIWLMALLGCSFPGEFLLSFHLGFQGLFLPHEPTVGTSEPCRAG